MPKETDIAVGAGRTYIRRMTVHRHTKMAAAIIIAISWSLLLLLHFHIVEWDQVG